MPKDPKLEAADELEDEVESETKSGLISMKRDKKTKKELQESMPQACGVGQQDEYSYGTRLNLQKEDLDKLGIKALPEVGKTMTLTAEVEVISVSQSSGKESDNRDMGLQITAMKLK